MGIEKQSCDTSAVTIDALSIGLGVITLKNLRVSSA